MRSAETDPIRKKILAAIDWLLDGQPLRSTGRLSVSQLAIEAGVARWRLTHQHLDLKEEFQVRVRNVGATPKPFQHTATELAELKQAHRNLQAYTAELEDKVKIYANVIQIQALEHAASAQGRPIIDIASRRSRAQ
jgi:hypothetical protein